MCTIAVESSTLTFVANSFFASCLHLFDNYDSQSKSLYAPHLVHYVRLQEHSIRLVGYYGIHHLIMETPKLPVGWNAS